MCIDIDFCLSYLNALIIPKLPTIARMLKCCHSPRDDGVVIVNQRTKDKQHIRVITLPSYTSGITNESILQQGDAYCNRLITIGWCLLLCKPEEMQTSTAVVKPSQNYHNCSHSHHGHWHCLISTKDCITLKSGQRFSLTTSVTFLYRKGTDKQEYFRITDIKLTSAVSWLWDKILKRSLTPHFNQNIFLSKYK